MALHLLSLHPANTRDMIIMLLWRIWSLRNDLTHGKNIPPPEVSKSFLCSYLNSIHDVKHLSIEQVIKGKNPVDSLMHAGSDVVQPPAPPWEAPPIGRLALSVDGSFLADDGLAGAGMVLRDSKGCVTFASCHVLFFCNDALEAKLQAILKGMPLALQWSTLPVIVQSDSVGALSALRDDSLARSAYGNLMKEIKALMEELEFIPKKIARSQNMFSHYLAKYARTEHSTAYWLHRPPSFISDLVLADCKPITME